MSRVEELNWHEGWRETWGWKNSIFTNDPEYLDRMSTTSAIFKGFCANIVAGVFAISFTASYKTRKRFSNRK